MQDVQKRALRYLAYIALGILILIPLLETRSVWRFVGLTGFLIIIINLLRIVLLSRKLIDTLYPITEEMDGLVLDKNIEWIAIAIFFGSFLASYAISGV